MGQCTTKQNSLNKVKPSDFDKKPLTKKEIILRKSQQFNQDSDSLSFPRKPNSKKVSNDIKLSQSDSRSSQKLNIPKKVSKVDPLDIIRLSQQSNSKKRPMVKLNLKTGKDDRKKRIKKGQPVFNNNDNELQHKFSAINISQAEDVAKESEYIYIPNNFKTHHGVAFSTVGGKIKLDAGLTGLYNMGNTCFLNTAIQCLSAVQPLTDFFIGDLYKQLLNQTNPMGTGGEVTLKYGNLIKDIWSGKEDKIYPAQIIKALGNHAPHLVCGMQQDAQEFLAYILDSMHEDLNRADKLQILKEQKEKQLNKLLQQKQESEEDLLNTEPSEEQQEYLACEAWKDHLFNNRSIIVDLFQGQLKSTLKCLGCQHMSIKFDSFMFLSVPIPKTQIQDPKLEECVEEFTKEEILDGQNKWKCPKCNKFQRATKKIDIWKLPSILIVHLKRFEFTEKKKAKINDFVEFPLQNLDLTPYVSKLQREKPIYDLFGVANHEGYLSGGHYFSYTKHRNNQMWYYFDDELVKKIKDDEQVVTKEAYILFYSKMTVDEFFRQTLSEPGLWPHILDQMSEKSPKKRLQNMKKSQTLTIQEIEDEINNKLKPQYIDINALSNQMTRIQSNMVSSNQLKLLEDEPIIDQPVFVEPENSNNDHSKNLKLDQPFKREGSNASSYQQSQTPFNQQKKFAWQKSDSISSLKTSNQKIGAMIMSSSTQQLKKNPQYVINHTNNVVINLFMKDAKY